MTLSHHISRAFSFLLVVLVCSGFSIEAHAQRPPDQPVRLCYNPATYGINGGYMSQVDEKLTNPANFGPAGKVATPISVVQLNRPITVQRLVDASCDVFQIGMEDGDAGSGTGFGTLSQSDVQAIKEWSLMDNSNVVLGAQGYITVWGSYFAQAGAVNPMNATPIGRAVAFKGPFGEVITGFNQGGNWQGVIVPGPSTSFCTIIEDSAISPRPAAIVDIPSGDIFFSDVDILSVLGGVTNSPNITSNNDVILANLHALIVKIVQQAPANVCGCTSCGFPPLTRSVLVDDLLARFKDGAVDLKWTPIPGAASYNVYRRTGSGTPALLRNVATVGGVFADGGLVNDTTYYYSVRWVSQGGEESPIGTEASATPTGRATRGNTPPTILSAPVTTAAIGLPYHYDVKAGDPDVGDPLTFAVAKAPASMVIDAASGAITWTPAAADAGYTEVAVRVTDTRGKFAAQTFRLFTTPAANRPPTITSTPTLNARVGLSYTYAMVAQDLDGDALSYSLGIAPPGMTINAATGVVQWLPSSEQAGSHAVSVRVTDAAGATAVQDFTIVVTVNRPPTIISQPILTAEVGVAYVYDVAATDPDTLDALTYRLVTGPSGMAINQFTGRVSWTPTASQQGAAPVSLTVSDLGGATATQAFIVQVNPTDTLAPVVALESPANGALLGVDTVVVGTVQDDRLVEWVLEYSPVGATLVWTRLATGSANLTSSVLATFPATLVANNPYRLRLTARDAHQAVSSQIEVQVHTSELKLGDFTLAFEDLRIPGLTFPISLTRTYDTKRPQAGDFGPGWFLGFTGVDVRRGTGYDVFVTLPTGRRVRFVHSPTGGGPFSVFTNRYLGDAGVVDTLDNTDCPLLLRSGSTYLCDGFQLYNPQNYLLRTKEGLTYTLTAAGGITRIVDRMGNRVDISPTGVTTSWGVSVPISRDAQNRIARIGEPSGSGGIDYAYDAGGRLGEVRDQSGHPTTFFYEAPRFPNYLTRVVDPLGRPSVRTLFDDEGRLMAQCDANADPVTLAGCVTFNPDVAARVQTLINARGFKTDLVLDPRGNVVTERRYLEDGTTQDVHRTYDAADNLLTQTDAASGTTTSTYDGRRNVLTSTGPDGRTTTYSYNACDKVSTETDPAGHTTSYGYDATCNLTSVTDALGGITRYEYNARGQRTGFIDAIGSRWTWTYDANGLLTSRIDPFGKATVTTFNLQGDLLNRTDRNGKRIDFEYDASHRLIRETWDNGRVTQYAYDSAGSLTSAVDPDSALAMTYTNLGQVRTVDNGGTPGAPRVMLTYDYDSNGSVTAVADSLGGVTNYAYDSLDRLARVTQSGTGVNKKRVDMAYNAAGLMTEMRRFSNLAGTAGVANTFYEYECASCPNRLTAIRHRKASDNSVINDLVYSRDTLGDITTLGDADGFHSYTYDGLRRLTTATHSNPTLQPNEFYTYDFVGNRLSSHLSGSHIYSYMGAAAVGSRLLGDEQHVYTYDHEGNLIRRLNVATGGSTEFSYDSRSRRTSVFERDGNGLARAGVTYAYDAIGRRISAITDEGGEYWTYDGANPLLKLSGDERVIIRRTYDRLVDVLLADDNASATNWFLTDQVSTVRDLVSDSGESTQHYVLSSFGQVLRQDPAHTLNDIVFASRETSKAGSIYFRSRYYDASSGRFESEDPVAPFRYEYVDNMPLTHTDPMGESVLETALKLGFWVSVIDCATAPFKGGTFIPLLDGCTLAYEAIRPAGVLFREIGKALEAVNNRR